MAESWATALGTLGRGRYLDSRAITNTDVKVSRGHFYR